MALAVSLRLFSFGFRIASKPPKHVQLNLPVAFAGMMQACEFLFGFPWSHASQAAH